MHLADQHKCTGGTKTGEDSQFLACSDDLVSVSTGDASSDRTYHTDANSGTPNSGHDNAGAGHGVPENSGYGGTNPTGREQGHGDPNNPPTFQMETSMLHICHIHRCPHVAPRQCQHCGMPTCTAHLPSSENLCVECLNHPYLQVGEPRAQDKRRERINCAE